MEYRGEFPARRRRASWLRCFFHFGAWMRFRGGVCSCLPHQSCAFQRWLVSRGRGIRRRPLTRPFSVQQRGAGGVERPLNPRSDAIRTCFRSAERVTALFVCLARNALSPLRIIRRRRNCFRRHLSFSDAPRLDTMEGILLGVAVPMCWVHVAQRLWVVR